MFKAVIFDMDGVIIDSEPAHYEVNKIIFNNLNITVSDSEYSKFIGVSNPVMWKVLKERHGLQQSVEELVINQTNANLDYIRNSNEKPIPGVISLLKEIKSYGLSIGLASSSPLEGINLVLDKFDIRNYFSSVISGENLKRGKPYPDIFLDTAKSMEVNPSECIVIEDSKHGVRAAKAAGMKCIGFRNANSGNQDLSIADLIVDSLEELNLSILRNLL